MNIGYVARTLSTTIVCIATFAIPALGQDAAQCTPEAEHANKTIVRRFYEQVWFTNNPEFVDEVFAPEYVAHDTGDRKNVTEKAEMQKEIAGFLWANSDISGSIDYQIADCNMVATRWQARFEPTSLLFKILGGHKQIPIINVMRFENGKVVEIWNHRHDIDTPMGNIKFVKGVAVGLIPAIIFFGLSLLLWRKLRKLKNADAQ